MMKTAIEMILVVSFFVAFTLVCFQHFESNKTGGTAIDTTSSNYAKDVYENIVVPQSSQQ